MRQQYFPEVDIVKGTAILLVILGHSFCVQPVDLNSEFPVFGEIMRSFHMPLFFIASGFLFSRRDNFTSFLKAKIIRLGIPYCVFGLITIFLKTILNLFAAKDNEEGVMTYSIDFLQGHYYWYLYALMIFMIVCYWLKNKWMLSIVSFITIMLTLFMNVRDISYFEIGRIIYFFPFFVLGMSFRKHYDKILGTISYSAGTIILGGVIYVLAWKYIQYDLIKLYIVTLSGALFVWGTSKWLSRWDMTILKHFGRYSLQYYLNHMLIMYPIYQLGSMIPTFPVFKLLIIFILAVISSYLMLIVEMRIKKFRQLCGIIEKRV